MKATKRFCQIGWVILIGFFLPIMAKAMPETHPADKASLQRGADLFMNYCLGCHSLKYVRYNSVAEGIGLTAAKNEAFEDLVKQQLIFTGDDPNSAILTSLANDDAKQWFGVVPPDLSLIVKIKGAAWVYEYLQSFYADPNRPWGTNNLLMPNVAMPNVLLNLQGNQFVVYQMQYNGMKQSINAPHLVFMQTGTMTPSQYAQAVNDIVNFLAYVAEPDELTRKQIGIGVLMFMLILSIVMYLLKRDYWKDIK